MIFVSIFSFIAVTFLLAKYAVNHKNLEIKIFQKSEKIEEE